MPPLQTFEYVTRGGQSKTIQASSSEEAMRNASDIAPNSGTRLIQQPAVAGVTGAPVDANQMTVGQYTPPTPTAPAVQATYMQSVQQEAQTARASLETEYKNRQAEADREIERLRGEEQRIMGEVEATTTPFREDLERAERNRLYINENFEANQKLTRELDTLLTEGNNLIRMQQGLPVSQRVVSARTDRAIQDVQARAGVINAVLSARNNQIAQAYTMIDRTVAAINADREDRLSYYDTLLSLNSKKLISLEDDSKKWAEAQVSLMQEDLKRSQAVADYIKELMISPDSAQFLAEAGVTLNDSVEQINAKMREQTERQQVRDFTNGLVADGYKSVPYAAPGTVAFEVGGKTLYFTPPPPKATSTSSRSLNSSVLTPLLGAGLNEAEASAIDQAVRTYGLAQVIQGELDAGADPEMLRVIADVYKGGANIYDMIEEAAAESEEKTGFFEGIGNWFSSWW